MSRFPDARAFFDSIYDGIAPWDIGRAQPALMALIDEYPPAEPILDVGCGTGDLVIELARRGRRVLGIDLAGPAVEQARERAAEAGAGIAERTEFRVADALRPSLLRTRFASVVDSGFFHVLEAHERDVLAEELATTLLPGGRYYVQAFAVEFALPNTPLQVTEEELRRRFHADAGWRILTIRAAEFETRIAPVPALVACIERLTPSPIDPNAATAAQKT